MVEPIEAIFPGLQNSAFRITSPATRAYNCIAWVAGDTSRWWWPDLDRDNDAVYWPAGVALEETLDAFAAALATVGYSPCSGEAPDPGFENVALFAKAGVPTHAARQLRNGLWTSKLGVREDIEHELLAICGAAYGIVALFLKRPFHAASPSQQ